MTKELELLRQWIGYLVSMAAQVDGEHARFYADKIEATIAKTQEGRGGEVKIRGYASESGGLYHSCEAAERAGVYGVVRELIWTGDAEDYVRNQQKAPEGEKS